MSKQQAGEKIKKDTTTNPHFTERLADEPSLHNPPDAIVVIIGRVDGAVALVDARAPRLVELCGVGDAVAARGR